MRRGRERRIAPSPPRLFAPSPLRPLDEPQSNPMYLLFLPGRTGQDANYLREAGLPELAAESPEFFFCDRGPVGEPGVLCRFANPLRPELTPAWDAAGYDWSPAAGADEGARAREGEGAKEASPPRALAPSPPRLFFGRPKGKPITPESLARKKLRPGATVRLADGQEWQIPIARQLPRVLGLSASRPTDTYKPFWELALKAVQEWLHVGDAGPYWSTKDDQLFAFACAALAINYRLAPPLVDWLGLVDTDNAFEILAVVTEGQCLARMLELEKKRVEASRSDAASTPDTPNFFAGEPG